jgi:hypothetical protein
MIASAKPAIPAPTMATTRIPRKIPIQRLGEC